MSLETRLAQARQVADVVLFEGYVLYPYRASAVKNQARWQFGVLAPHGTPGEPWYSRTECLVEPAEVGGRPDLAVTARFLQVQRRAGPVPWDEAVVSERTATVALDPQEPETVTDFAVPGGEEVDGAGIHRRWPLRGAIRVAATGLPGPYGLLRVGIRLENRSPVDGPVLDRADMLPHAFVSAHLLIAVRGGAFVSLLEPPEWAAPAVRSCRHEGAWPVLVGSAGGPQDVMLSAPIILYDNPSIAPESPGDLYDSTEIDEILTLRTMTLTDEEKHEVRATDPRAAALVDRVDAMPAEVLERLHGAVRYLRRVTAPSPSGLPQVGSRVRLKPHRQGTDAQDMFVAGRAATVRRVLSDVDGRSYLAVTLDDDPVAAELQAAVGRYRYFGPDEVELMP